MRSVRINNFIKNCDRSSKIDYISQIFIFFECTLGLNRISVICSVVYVQIFACVYIFFFVSALLYTLYQNKLNSPREFIEITKLIQYIMCNLLAFLASKRIRRYYAELNNFDSEVGCKPKVTRESFLIMLTTLAISCVIIFVFRKPRFMSIIPIHLVGIIENNYYGYLFHLLNQRLSFINDCLESSLTTVTPLNANTKKKPFIIVTGDGKSFQFAMNKLMDFYCIIIAAYDSLIDAIKWQLVLITTTSFIYTLGISYYVSIYVIHGDINNHSKPIIFDLLLVCSEILPLMTPCMCCDVVRKEVRKLRELLASKLFESKLDKVNRSVARALLALTKARDLSFSLLRMVDISISLPFSFLGLLATYLIILLQFARVINPNFNSDALETNVTSN